jgi:hypothetical protein
VPRYTHSLTDVAALLDQRIAALRELKTEVQDRISKNIGLQVNAEALRQISASLAHARDARAAIEESCCGMGCNIDFQDSDLQQS